MLQRQGSKTSTKSSKSTTSALQKRIEEYMLEHRQGEWQQQRVFDEKRRRKKLLKRAVNDRKRLKRIRLLYFPAVVGMACGVIMLFGATVRTISDGTFLWTHRRVFVIAGPVVLVVGVIFLFLAVGLESREVQIIRRHIVEVDIEQTKHPDFEKTQLSRMSSVNSSTASPSVPNNSQGTQPNVLHPFYKSRDFSLESSMSSTTSMEVTQCGMVSNWARAISHPMDTEPSAPESMENNQSKRTSPVVSLPCKEIRGTGKTLSNGHIKDRSKVVTSQKYVTSKVVTDASQLTVPVHTELQESSCLLHEISEESEVDLDS